MWGLSRSRYTIHHFPLICTEKAMSYLYLADFGPENDGIGAENTYFWDVY
jgi:hypothetical protein